MEQIGVITALRDIGREKNVHRVTTRIGAKKINAILISDDHARALKNSHPPTAQGAKDRLLMCILIDLGLSSSEVVALTLADMRMDSGKVNVRKNNTITKTLRLTRDVRKALLEYLTYQAPTGKLLDHSTRSLTARVRFHGKRLGYANLSAHDLRHYLATKLAREGLSAHQLMETMGWRSLATAQRYIEASAIANGAAAAIIDGEEFR